MDCGLIRSFAGENSPAQITNDLNPERPTTHHMDALEFLKTFADKSVDGVLYDPPYSITQAAECYRSYGKEKLEISISNMKYWSSCKDEVARILKPNGKAICFGWSSMGVGLKRGFTMNRILLVPHGGSKNDTICTVETKNM
jgi:DNA modification methylase